ncbi:MAG TPA: ParA family protein [Candidatus Saccharimonadales bacterium]|nr:ParA family protein [Candidatus Saccharimonadales bacterium]
MNRNIITIFNQKGGVGKTTTAINVAAYLAKDDKTVLLIDFDPQGNATSGMGLDKEQSAFTSYEALLHPDILTNAIHETNLDNLYILPANSSLAAAELELASLTHRETRLRSLLAQTQYDYIIIDCPPALGLLSINALAAATDVLIPVQAEYYALEGLGQLLSIVQRIRETVNPNLELLGVVLTMYDKRTALADQVQRELEKHLGDKLLETVIPRNVRLAEAPSFGRTIIEHDKWSKGARAYKQLTKEIVSRANH